MLPSLVPNHVKSDTAIRRSVGKSRIYNGIMAYSNYPGILFMHHIVELAQEVESLEVFISTVHVRNPCIRRTSVITVEHRSERIYQKSVDMELLQPVHSASDEEV